MRSKRSTAINLLISIFGAGFLSLAFAACDIALGSSINMNGPVLAITEPSLNEGALVIPVANAFSLKGTAKGNDKVVRMEIKMDYYNPRGDTTSRLGREWRFEEGAWKYKEDGYLPWKTYSESDYSNIENLDLATVQSPIWQAIANNGSGNTVNWSLPILLHNLDTGDYFITINAWDTAGHHDSNSMQKIKVYYVNKEPQFDVLAPNLIPGELSQDIRNPDVPGIIDSWVYDPVNKPEETYLYINNWITEPLELKWAINDAAAAPYPYLKIEFTNKHQLDEFTGKELYYRYELPDQTYSAIPQYGILTDNASPIGFDKAGPAIQGIRPLDIDTGAPLGATLPNGSPTYIQVVSSLHDASGNKATHKSKGFFAYLPDADKPWVDIKFGNKWANLGAVPPLTILDRYLQKEIPQNLNLAYSKHGLKGLSWKLYRLRENSLDPVASGDGSEGSPFEGDVAFTPDRRRALWSFISLTLYGEGGFKIVVTVEDVNGNTGEYTAYFTVESNATPTVKSFAPELESPIAYFGTSARNGDFEISGRAQVENVSAIHRVSIAWIRPHSDPSVMAERQLKYTDRNYAKWDSASPGGVYEDGTEAKIWELLPTSDFVRDGATAGNPQVEYAFSKTLNIFDDLDVGPGPAQNRFDGQVFLVRVLTNTTSGKTLSSVRAFATTGDNTPPKLTITSITVSKVSGLGSGTFHLPFAIGFKLPTLMAGDKIRLTGTWDDDSLAAWSNVSPAQLKSFFKNFEVTWNWNNGTWAAPRPGEVPMPGCVFDTDGTWATGDYTFTENNLSNSVMVQASITDLNNNRGFTGNNGEGELMEIQLDIPVLSRVSSTASDGYYGINKNTDPLTPGSRYIDIFLEFNKNLKFYDPSLGPYPVSGKVPYLLLNNGGRAYFLEGNGDSKFTFRYFVDGNHSSLPYAPAQIDADHDADRGGNSSPGRLNLVVNGVIGEADYPLSEWKSVDGDTALTIDPQIFSALYPLSLAYSKNIVIDKNPPLISRILTSASNALYHGEGSSIYITVIFDKTISVPKTLPPGDFWLDLRGGNLVTKAAKALFTNVAGPSSISFQYVVQSGHDTSTYSDMHLNIASIDMNGVKITDVAENEFTVFTLPYSGILYKNSNMAQAADLVIDTTAPPPPNIEGVAPANYYDSKTFNITGLESRNVTVEYTLNYTGEASSTWVTVQSPIQGTGTNSCYINGIPLDSNGTYTLAARQYDNATTPNRSAVSASVGPVLIDKGALLTRIGSKTTADGIYGAGQQIKIDLEFRIPVYVPAGNASVMSLGLNVPGRSAGQATPSTDNKIWTFTYTIQQGDDVESLNITSLNMGAAVFRDANSTSATSVNSYIGFDLGNTNHQFSKQKNITILTGYPGVDRRVISYTGLNGSSDIALRDSGGGKKLEFRFNRNIYRGDTTEPLLVRQLAADYRIPAVLKDTEWANRFLGRDLGDAISVPPAWNPPAGYANTKADYWRWLGNVLYQKGTNGAKPGSWPNTLEPDPVIKYVLRYDIDTAAADGVQIGSIAPGLPGAPGLQITMRDIRTAFREAEALSFDAYDREVTIEKDAEGKPRILTISLTGDKLMPVKGDARYELTFPNGFVKDFLEKPNGGEVVPPNKGADAALGSGISPLSCAGTESPVIRIKKGEDIDTITGTGINRQAVQPLRSEARLDSRIPGEIQYRTRSTTDNVGELIWRSQPAHEPRRLPNLGTPQEPGAMAEFNEVKGRPQSGNSPHLPAHGSPGLDHWNRMVAWSGGYTTTA
jgi:hypothetical protein